MTDPASGGSRSLAAGCRSAARLFWDELPAFVVVSVCWVVASLPLVTIGPATVGAYAATHEIRSARAADIVLDPCATTRKVIARTRDQFVPAVLLTGVPLAFVGVGGAYAVEYVTTGAVAVAVVSAVALLAGLQLVLALIPTFIALATDSDVPTAIREGYLWTVSDPIAAVGISMITVSLATVSLLFTVAFVLAFGGLTACLHVEVVARPAQSPDETPAGSP